MPNIVDLNSEKLVECVLRMQANGISFRCIETKSNTSNISRLASGQLHPTVDMWRKLHAAFPEWIPEPEYSDGARLIKISNSSFKSSIIGNRDVTTSNHHMSESSSHQYAHELISGLDEESVKTVIKFILKLNTE